MLGWIEQRWRDAVPENIPYTDPLRAGRHPFQTFMLVLCIISGAPLLVGRVTAGSIEETLPDWMAFGWGCALFFGSLVALVGSRWRGHVDTALLLERTGLDVVGLAAVCYTIAIVTVASWGGVIAAAIVLGFGGSCLRRARDIARIFGRAKNGG